MPKQDWNINTGKAYAGEMYGIAATNSQRLTYSTEDEQASYGLAVVQGTKDNLIKKGHDAGAILGITMREIKLESKTRPGDGQILIPLGQPLTVMLSGPIMVKLKTAISDRTIGVSVDGEFGGVDGTYTAATNVTPLRWPAAAGEVIPVMVNVIPKP